MRLSRPSPHLSTPSTPALPDTTPSPRPALILLVFTFLFFKNIFYLWGKHVSPIQTSTEFSNLCISTAIYLGEKSDGFVYAHRLQWRMRYLCIRWKLIIILKKKFLKFTPRPPGHTLVHCVAVLTFHEMKK